MEAFIYLSKSIAILSIFYGVYFLFFRKDTLFTAKRHFFLAGIIAAIVLPFVTFTKTIYIERPSVSEIDFSLVNLVPVTQIIDTTPIETPFNWWLLVYGIYALGVLVFLTRFSIQLLSLRKLLKNNHSIREGNYRFVETSENISPFSFFRYIVYNPKQHNKEELEMILQHEKIHASQWHSIDLLAANLLRAMQWINPFSWLYKKSLEENLEFIADQETITQVTSKKQYQLTLLKTSSPLTAPALTTQFYQSFIKKRIIMLNKSTSQKRNAWKLTLVLPLLCFFLWSFNVKEEISYIAPETTPSKIGLKFSILPEYTDAELDQMEVYFKESAPHEVKISNRKRDAKGNILSFDFQTKFEGQDQFYTRFSRSNKATVAYEGHIISYKEGEISVLEIGPKATAFNITKDRLEFVDLEFVTPVPVLKKEAILITSEISEDELNAIELELENQSSAFEIDFKDRKRNAAGQLIELSIDTKYKGQPRFYKNVTYTGEKNNKTIGSVKLQVLDNQLHFGNEDDSMLNKITPDGVVALVFQKKEGAQNNDLKMGENPLYIINGKEYYKEDLPAHTNFEVSDGIEMIHPKQALKKYGSKGKDGVIIFKGITTFTKDTETENPLDTPNEVSAYITKKSPPAVFKKVKKELMDAYGVELRYIDQRNEKGEINNLEFYFFENDKEIGTLGLGLYNPAPIESSTFYYTKNGRFNFWNATKYEKLKKRQETRQQYTDQYLDNMAARVPSSFNFRITNSSTDAELEEIKTMLKEKLDIIFEYKAKRNNEGKIIAISLHHTDQDGNSGNYNVSGASPIKEVNFFKNKNGIGYANTPYSNNEIQEVEEIEEVIVQEIREIQEEREEIREEALEERKVKRKELKEEKKEKEKHLHKTQHNTQNHTQNTRQTYHHLETGNHNAGNVHIHKDTSDGDLLNIKKELLEKGITFKFKRVKRNSNGELTRIKIQIENSKTGKQSIYATAENDKPIEDIVIAL